MVYERMFAPCFARGVCPEMERFVSLFNPKTVTRDVCCYHCGLGVQVPAAARTASCPKCYKGLVLDDLTVRDASGSIGKLTTCGGVTIMPKARSITRRVEAGGDVVVHGHLEASVSSGGAVRLGERAHVKGDVTARCLVVEPGAIIDGGYFRIGPRTPGLECK